MAAKGYVELSTPKEYRGLTVPEWGASLEMSCTPLGEVIDKVYNVRYGIPFTVPRHLYNILFGKVDAVRAQFGAYPMQEVNALIWHRGPGGIYLQYKYAIPGAMVTVSECIVAHNLNTRFYGYSEK